MREKTTSSSVYIVTAPNLALRLINHLSIYPWLIEDAILEVQVCWARRRRDSSTTCLHTFYIRSLRRHVKACDITSHVAIQGSSWCNTSSFEELNTSLRVFNILIQWTLLSYFKASIRFFVTRIWRKLSIYE